MTHSGGTRMASYEIDIQDVEDLRHGNTPLLARLHTPKGDGPLPMVVASHGGGGTREGAFKAGGTNEPAGKSGVIVAAIDFRMPPDGAYPASMADINYAIRWLKSRAGALRGRADRVGLMGSSSGGQQAML